jgi:hypothetical protein
MTPFEASQHARKIIMDTGLKVGAVICPLCGQTIHFTVHSNGHIHAKCENIKCIRWME